MMRIAVLLLLAVMSWPSSAERKPFVTVEPEPPNIGVMWWLRAEYHPFGKTIRGIPIKLISGNWCYANEFTAGLLTEEYMKDISSRLSFAVEGRFDNRKKLTALVGAYEACDHKKGLFLLILEPRKNVKIVRFLEQFDFQNTLVALQLASSTTLELWWCSSCDNYQTLGWNNKLKKFAWLAEEEEDATPPQAQDDAQPLIPPDLSRQAAPGR